MHKLTVLNKIKNNELNNQQNRYKEQTEELQLKNEIIDNKIDIELQKNHSKNDKDTTQNYKKSEKNKKFITEKDDPYLIEKLYITQEEVELRQKSSFRISERKNVNIFKFYKLIYV